MHRRAEKVWEGGKNVDSGVYVSQKEQLAIYKVNRIYQVRGEKK